MLGVLFGLWILPALVAPAQQPATQARWILSPPEILAPVSCPARSKKWEGTGGKPRRMLSRVSGPETWLKEPSETADEGTERRNPERTGAMGLCEANESWLREKLAELPESESPRTNAAARSGEPRTDNERPPKEIESSTRSLSGPERWLMQIPGEAWGNDRSGLDHRLPQVRSAKNPGKEEDEGDPPSDEAR